MVLFISMKVKREDEESSFYDVYKILVDCWTEVTPIFLAY